MLPPGVLVEGDLLPRGLEHSTGLVGAGRGRQAAGQETLMLEFLDSFLICTRGAVMLLVMSFRVWRRGEWWWWWWWWW